MNLLLLPSPHLTKSTKKRKETSNLDPKNPSKRSMEPLISTYQKLRIWKSLSKMTATPLSSAHPSINLIASFSKPLGKASKPASPLHPHKIT
jgi:hypothetical protein